MQKEGGEGQEKGGGNGGGDQTDCHKEKVLDQRRKGSIRKLCFRKPLAIGRDEQFSAVSTVLAGQLLFLQP